MIAHSGQSFLFYKKLKLLFINFLADKYHGKI